MQRAIKLIPVDLKVSWRCRDYWQMIKDKCQKHNRIGPLTLVPFAKEPILNNITDACKSHFGTNCECDVLASERGHSYTNESQIKDWSKVIHIRFLEYEQSQKAQEPVFVRPLHKSRAIMRRQLSQNCP